MVCCRFEGVQLVVISNTLWVGEQVPCLTYGMRGMISLSLEVPHLHPLPRVSGLDPRDPPQPTKLIFTSLSPDSNLIAT